MKQYKCFLCSYTFEKIDDCLDHLKKRHNHVAGKDEFTCIVNNQCARSFLTIKSLKVHVKKW